MTLVISFLSQKGGVGKSSIARALAVACVNAGLKVLLADLDSRQQTIVNWNERRRHMQQTPYITVRTHDNVHAAIHDAGTCELLILDTSSRVTRETLEIARWSHLIIQPSIPTLDDLHPTVLLFHELSQAGIPQERLSVALFRTIDDEEAVAARAYIEESGYEVLNGSIPEHVAFREAQNKGRSLVETDDAEMNARADQLLEAILLKLSTLADKTA